MGTAYKKILVIFLGLLFTIVLLEVFFRLFYLISTQDSLFVSQQNNQKADYKILFLGNSHTFGAGVDKKDAYPGVLQRFFDQQLSGKNYKVAVFNEGVPNANSYEIYKNFESNYEKIKPNLALVMSGEPNIWNKNGYNEYADSKNKQSRGDIYNFFIKAGNYIKTIRWIMSFENLTKKDALTPSQEDEKIVYKEIAEVEKNFYEVKAKDLLTDRTKKAFENYIGINYKNPPKEAWRAVLYALSRLNYYTYSDYEGAFKTIRMSIDFQKDEFDMYSYLFVKKILDHLQKNAKEYSQVVKIFDELKSHPKYPGENRVEEIFNYTIRGERKGSSRFGLDYKLILESHNFFKIFTVASVELAMYQRKALADYEASNITILEAFKGNPFSVRSGLAAQIKEMASESNFNDKTKNIAREYMKDFLIRFPDEKYYFDHGKNETQLLYDWIRSDTVKLIQKSKELELPLIVQNYHWIRDRSEADSVNQAIESAAQSEGINFLDLHKDFMQIVKANSSEIDSYFIQSYGYNDSHPSEKGHRLIAYLIYKYLVKEKLLPQELRQFDPEIILKPN